MSIVIKTKSSISGNGFNSLRGREGPFAITGKIVKFAIASKIVKLLQNPTFPHVVQLSSNISETDLRKLVFTAVWVSTCSEI